MRHTVAPLYFNFTHWRHLVIIPGIAILPHHVGATDNFISIWDALDFTCDVEFYKVVSVLHIRVKMISFHYYLVDLTWIVPK